MSLGRLLRRASSKASDFLTLNSSGGSPSALDGEIIYSKNNVCVHPTDQLQGLGEHHPGYLCIHMEKDEMLGTTLTLTWVPNSRIQRQDEEALRYITPESSPVRKAPRRRSRYSQGSGSLHFSSHSEKKQTVTLQDDEMHISSPCVTNANHGENSLDDQLKTLPQSLTLDSIQNNSMPTQSDSGILSTITSQEEHSESETLSTEKGKECHSRTEQSEVEDEGSYDLSADDVSRDSTFGSDSDTFSSPFCLSPISEALAESSSSVFLDNESRDFCEDKLMHSANQVSKHTLQLNLGLRTPSQLHNTGWTERRKFSTLDHMYGVFTVELGCIYNLPVFITFSDEACTCGQLVIASRESQYKIFHFHHGGLDKLAEVFQQWKYCTETHLKDQVSDEKTCMHFSIRRPNLPSTETHPEENMHKRLNVTIWLNHLNESGQVEEEYKLRKAIFFGGIDVSIRGEVWPFLLHYYSWDSTSEDRENLRMMKKKQYQDIQQKRLSMSPAEQKEFWRNVQFTVDKDVVRTDRSNQFFKGEDNPNVEAMRRILLNYAVYNPEMGYCQGMSDLVAPILTEVQDESDTFWCFVGLMQNTIFNSSPRDDDMEKQLMYLRELLRLMHPRFYQHLVSLGEDGMQMLFCHRWILLCFKREFPDAEALRIWEACWAHYQTDYFHLFICVAIIVIYGDDVVDQLLANDQMLLHFSNLTMHMNGELVLRKARSLLYQFRLLTRIPCSLHELCRLCGTGMWDSGYMPAVECTGNHPDLESCPFGGTVEVSSPNLGTEAKRGIKTRDVFNFRK
ncbi:TBC1 domain family member 16 [Protopterus annectens]|uniref:TBC1 domain family member 16 n=1 Tax=Protopterus annectens TaxID=7888 RepID=UPI001CFB396A|nr:TBC1 domain family member 16 [Protopterus annectens]